MQSYYDNEHKKVALVKFYGGDPLFLSELVENPLENWQVKMGDRDINFGCYFFGFTQLYTPTPDALVSVELVAPHPLPAILLS